ncbi:cytochrome c3 family protein [Sutterella wadsworthensis]|uniref:cytochrome c3 family protein n=1 Tax=Sutterella wadsworthensis TaxID=40545 RepID=UPI0006231C80|nr:cytochrome c3 family protein [Sutterella wadsworthensis]QQS90641.1 cytochrome c3 family protein [Sutterella wadsworthensis]RBP51953.1 cytochrome c3-like protein [Sutterella wadsworthensis]
MKQIFAACAAVVLVMGVTAPIHAGTPFSLKHKGVDCAACHKTQSPAQPAAQDACIGCHGQYKGKPVPNADYNPDRNPRRPVVEVNPHDSHLGNVRCTLCHKEHQASPKTACYECHQNFILNAK